MTGMAADMTDMTGPYRLPSELTETGHALLVHLGSLHFRYHAHIILCSPARRGCGAGASSSKQ